MPNKQPAGMLLEKSTTSTAPCRDTLFYRNLVTLPVRTKTGTSTVFIRRILNWSLKKDTEVQYFASNGIRLEVSVERTLRFNDYTNSVKHKRVAHDRRNYRKSLDLKRDPNPYSYSYCTRQLFRVLYCYSYLGS